MDNLTVPELLKAMRAVSKSRLTLAERLEIGLACRDLQLEVDRPWDTMLRIVWQQVRLCYCTVAKYCQLTIL